MIHTCHTNNQIYVSEKLRQKIAQAQRTWNQSNEAPSAAPISGLGLPGSKAVPYLPGPARGLNHHDGDTTPSGAFHTGSLSQSKPHGHQQRGHAPWVTYRRRHRFIGHISTGTAQFKAQHSTYLLATLLLTSMVIGDPLGAGAAITLPSKRALAAANASALKRPKILQFGGPPNAVISIQLNAGTEALLH